MNTEQITVTVNDKPAQIESASYGDDIVTGCHLTVKGDIIIPDGSNVVVSYKADGCAMRDTMCNVRSTGVAGQYTCDEILWSGPSL